MFRFHRAVPQLSKLIAFTVKVQGYTRCGGCDRLGRERLRREKPDLVRDDHDEIENFEHGCALYPFVMAILTPKQLELILHNFLPECSP